MPIKIGSSHRFAPRPFTTLVTLALLALLLALGRWQLQRADEKRRLFDAFDAGSDLTRPIDSATPPLPRYQRLEANGHYDGTRQILIDNMVGDDGRAGYFVVTPFALRGGGWLLVNRGWIPLGANRADRPSIGVGADERPLHGRADRLPAPGIRMGTAAAVTNTFPIVANYPRRADIEQWLNKVHWALAAEIVLLDPGDPDGYVRHWSAPGLPPQRHIAYAVQWFGLAAALLVIYAITNVQRE